ncbi:MAG TPA: radical SAM protein [Nitrososphaeraceae archaeon]|jgi:sulfatase maturation enzyme AslB (radical SAM superfamily)
MVDLIYGRGITDIIHETPFYFSIFKKYASIKLLHAKPALYGSVDIINVCNLHCTHCYWWLNRKENDQDLSAERWREIIKQTFKKQHIYIVTLVGGEPTLRPDIIQVFCEEMPRRVCVVTNGTYPLKRFENLYFYWISLDGTETVHDSIRGRGSYAKTKQNILDYSKGPPRHGKPAWKDIWITMTINSVNYNSITDLVEEWRGKVNKIGFQFHTPFIKDDPLWIPFGKRRSEMVDIIIELGRKYPDFVINGEKQLSLMKGNWGGVGTIPVQCPSWAILSLDHMGRVKQPCCIGSADSKGLKPICEQCGLGCYSVLVANGITGS